MKLLRKTSRTYLIISASSFIIAGLVIYFVTSFFIEEQMNEKLLTDRMSVIHSIERDNTLPYFYPFVEVKVLPVQSGEKTDIQDTLIYDEVEKEYIPFRQINSYVNINGKTYCIIVRDTLLEKSDMLMIIGIAVGLVFLLLSFILYFINKRLSLKIWKPFYTTLNDLKNFSQYDTVFKLSSATGVDEFIELNKTLENLTSRVISDYQSLKRFTEDASHEIQTPLAIAQTKLETLMQYPDINKDQAEIIKATYSSVQRISKLTQSLLLLTKIANDQFPEKISVNLSVLLNEKVKQFEGHIYPRSLVIITEIVPDCFFLSNYFLVESMITNIIGNAIRHSTQDGVITIKLDKQRFEVSNPGSPFSVPPSKLFERFYKANAHAESLGLGLSIVKEICTLNKWVVGYNYEGGLHKFSVVF